MLLGGPETQFVITVPWPWRSRHQQECVNNGHWLRILVMASGFVLLIVCANVANLIMVRGLERRRETSLNMASGARASRVVTQATSESILLSLLGGVAGLAIAFVGTRLILHFPSSLDSPACPLTHRLPLRWCKKTKSTFRRAASDRVRRCYKTISANRR